MYYIFPKICRKLRNIAFTIRFKQINIRYKWRQSINSTLPNYLLVIHFFKFSCSHTNFRWSFNFCCSNDFTLLHNSYLFIKVEVKSTFAALAVSLSECTVRENPKNKFTGLLSPATLIASNFDVPLSKNKDS